MHAVASQPQVALAGSQSVSRDSSRKDVPGPQTAPAELRHVFQHGAVVAQQHVALVSRILPITVVESTPVERVRPGRLRPSPERSFELRKGHAFRPVGGRHRNRATSLMPHEIVTISADAPARPREPQAHVADLCPPMPGPDDLDAVPGYFAFSSRNSVTYPPGASPSCVMLSPRHTTASRSATYPLTHRFHNIHLNRLDKDHHPRIPPGEVQPKPPVFVRLLLRRSFRTDDAHLALGGRSSNALYAPNHIRDGDRATVRFPLMPSRRAGQSGRFRRRNRAPPVMRG